MNGWDNLEEWVEKEAEDLVKRAKTKAGEVFLTSVTSPTNFNKKLPAGGMGGNTPVRTGNLIANTEVGITTGNGQTAIFTIVSPGEDILAENLTTIGFKPIHTFERRVGYPKHGDLTMYIKNL